MTKIDVQYSDETIVKVVVQGHALFAEQGEDIVCASISSLLIFTINVLEKLRREVTYKLDEALIEIDVSLDETSQLICEQLIDSLLELTIDYPQHVEVKKWR